MFVSAVDREGEPVAGLGPDAFQIREDGVKREVLRVSRATEPIDVAILVDNSAAASDDITFLRSSLSKFVARMAPGNRMAVIALADRPTILVDYTDDTKRLSDAVGRLFPMSQSGMTLLDAIFETTRGLAKRETPRAVIVPVFTDGVEFTNRYSKDIVATLRTRMWLFTWSRSASSITPRSMRRVNAPSCWMRAPGAPAANASRCSARMGSKTRCNGWRVNCLRSTRSCTDAQSRS